MILDKQNLLSDAQALTTSAASTNVIDLGADDASIQAFVERAGEIFCQVGVALETGTSVAVAVQVDDDVAFGSATTLYTTAAIATASLVEGYKFTLGKFPAHISERYMRLYYTIVGTFDAGSVDAGIVLDEQTNGPQ